MQTAKPPSFVRRTREISFSSLQNYNSKSGSRDQSPSIAVESTLELSPKDEQKQNCLHSIHKKYMIRNELILRDDQGLRKETDTSLAKQNILSNCINILKCKASENSHHNKSQRIIQFFQNKSAANIFMTPSKSKEKNESIVINQSIYYSNTSPIEDEQKQKPHIQRKDKRSISSIDFPNNDDQYQMLSPESYRQLTHRYLNSSKENQAQFSQGKIQNQISKLKKQIEKLQQLKKEIKDKPTIENNQHPSIQKQYQTFSISFSKTTQESTVKSHVLNIKEKINIEDVKTPKLLNKTPSKSKRILNQTATNCEGSLSLHLKPSVPQRIEEEVKTSRKESQSLVRCLQEQIRLDDALRKAKKWFKRWNNHQKWQELAQIIPSLTQIAIKATFSLTSEQQNPFYVPKDSDFTLKQLVSNYNAAENHWRDRIANQYSIPMLKKGSFVEENLDISKRGEIYIEDLVRYINYELDATFRNRDIFLIFCRFSQGEPLHFTKILRCLSSEPF